MISFFPSPKYKPFLLQDISKFLLSICLPCYFLEALITIRDVKVSVCHGLGMLWGFSKGPLWLKAEKPNTKVSESGKCQILAVTFWKVRNKTGQNPPFNSSIILPLRAESSWSRELLSIPPLNIVPTEVRFQHEFWRGQTLKP